MTLVLAGNRSEFLDWCRENNKNPRDRNISYISNAIDVMGFRGYNVVRVGTWRNKKDIAEILERIALTKDN